MKMCCAKYLILFNFICFARTMHPEDFQDWYRYNPSLSPLEIKKYRYFSGAETSGEETTEALDIEWYNIRKLIVNASEGNLVQTLSRFKNITSLYVISNRDLPDDLLQSCDSLEQLYLDLAKNIKSIPEHIFKNAKSLQKLFVFNSEIRRIQPGLFANLVSLRVLDLRNNNLTELLPGIFNNLGNLQILNLKENLIERISPGVFHGLDNVTDIILSNNLIREWSELSFSTPTKFLNTLDLNGNKIRNLDSGSFKNCPSVRLLNLNNNRLEFLKEGVFSGMVNLMELNLQNNAFEVFDITALQSVDSSLTTLHLEGNFIASVRNTENIRLKSLNFLYLGENKLETLSNNAFTAFSALRILDLRQNKIEAIEENAFGGLDGLEFLELPQNKITKVQSLHFKDLKLLRGINLGDNEIPTIDESSFGEIPTLDRLYLSENRLINIGEGAFDQLENLDSLDLSYNGLTNIGNPFKNNKSLRILWLRYNYIKTLDDSVFENSKWLTSVFVDNNDLRVLDPGMIERSTIKEFTFDKDKLPESDSLKIQSIIEQRNFRRRCATDIIQKPNMKQKI